MTGCGGHGLFDRRPPLSQPRLVTESQEPRLPNNKSAAKLSLASEDGSKQQQGQTHL